MDGNDKGVPVQDLAAIILVCALIAAAVMFLPGGGEEPAAIAATAADTAAGLGTEPQSRAEEILAGMTVEEKVGQMFFAGMPDGDAAGIAAEDHLGGYVLFARNFAGKTREEAAEMIDGVRCAGGIPLFIGVDEEGGTVNRVSLNPELRGVPFWSPQDLYEEGGFELIRSDTQEKCELLSSLGINVNFAPVCDVSQDPDDFIYDRSFGRSAGETAEYAGLVVRTMSEEGMGSALKHFPGYGGNSDTHTGLAYDSRPYETFVNSDFLPFRAGIEAGAGMVMVSHNIVECMDPDRPASLSPEVHEILRTELGFDGVIITDDLNMEAVAEFTGEEHAAVLAVLAGNDMLCCSDYRGLLSAVLGAVDRGTITEERIDESVLRILELKLELGIIE